MSDLSEPFSGVTETQTLLLISIITALHRKLDKEGMTSWVRGIDFAFSPHLNGFEIVMTVRLYLAPLTRYISQAIVCTSSDLPESIASIFCNTIKGQIIRSQLTDI